METLKADVLYGLRMLRKSPAFAMVAVLTLALGIGANTSLFSIVDWILLRPLPIADPQQLMVLAWQQKNGHVNNQFSVPAFRDIRAQAAGFSSVAGYQIGIDGLSVNGKADRLMTYYVTGELFNMLGIKPAAGRLLLPGEGEQPNADAVVVLGYAYWQQRFGGDAGVVGRKVTINGRPFTIVGVAPKGFWGPYPIIEGQAYFPLGMLVIEGTPADFMANRGLRNVTLLARLRSDSTLEQARASLAVLGKQLATANPQTEKDVTLLAFPEVRSRPQPDPNNTIVILSGLFLGLAGLVLLLACLNVANILLVRATLRQKEMAVRAALGATRGRLIRQLLTESLVLALLGGAAGMLLGWAGSAALSSVNLQTDLPVRLDFGFNWRIFAYAFSAALATGIIVGIVPAVRVSRGNLNELLHQSGRSVVGGGARLRASLVVVQVGGSLMLLIAAGLFARSLAEAQRTNLGFDPEHVANFLMDPTEIGYTPQQTTQFYRNLLARIRTLPGVESATTASTTPMGYYNNADALLIEGYDQPAGQPRPGALYDTISTDYFQTLRIPQLSGRLFREADDERAPYVAIVNESLAKRYWPNQDAIGRRFQLASEAGHTISIVGVVRNSRYSSVTGPIGPVLYLPAVQHAATSSLQALHVRAAGDAAAIIPEVQRAVQSLAPDLPMFDVMPMKRALYTLNGLLAYQLGAGFAAALGLLGLVLSVVGVYGVISYSASQRTQEIGIRLALGARPRQIRGMILRQGAIIVAIGAAFGLAGAFAAGRVLRGFLAVSSTDPTTFAGVSLVLVLVAMAACYIPARRTMRVDPMVALRHE
jgi:predicted permease